MIQLNSIQFTSQIIKQILLKWLKSYTPASVEVELLTAIACLEYASSVRNKTHR